MDEINNDPEQVLEPEKKSRMDQRVENALSEKAKAEEATIKAQKAQEKSEKEAEVAKKDLEFFKNFNTVSAKYQGAAEYQDQIKEKTALGLDVEEATMLVLAKEGKYNPPPAAKAPVASPAGGSAVNTLKAGGEKPINEMTRAEMRAALIEAEQRGDMGLS